MFSFWDNGVRLWDVDPVGQAPTTAVLEGLRQALKVPANLRRARELWWQIIGDVCLVNQEWDGTTEEVVPPRLRRRGAKRILSATFDAAAYKTVLGLAGRPTSLEIGL